jgi:hypothetical protein
MRLSRTAPAPALNDTGNGLSEVQLPVAGSNRSSMSSGRPLLPTMPAAT